MITIAWQLFLPPLQGEERLRESANMAAILDLCNKELFFTTAASEGVFQYNVLPYD